MIDGNTLSVLAGGVLSLVMSYTPKLKDWFAKRSPVEKRLVMGGLIIGSGVGLALYNCNLSLECLGEIDLNLYITAIVSALVGNQTAYQLSPASSKS